MAHHTVGPAADNSRIGISGKVEDGGCAKIFLIIGIEQRRIRFGHNKSQLVEGVEVGIGPHKETGFAPHSRAAGIGIGHITHYIDPLFKSIAVGQREQVSGIDRLVGSKTVGDIFVGEKVKLAAGPAVAGMCHQQSFAQRTGHI